MRIDMGRKWLATADVVALEPGCIIELDRLVDDDADMYVDGKLFAKGQPVAVNGTCAMRVQEIVASNAQARLAGRKPR